MGTGGEGGLWVGSYTEALSPSRFPLFTAVYNVCYEGQPVGEFIRCLQNHPEHM